MAQVTDLGTLGPTWDSGRYSGAVHALVGGMLPSSTKGDAKTTDDPKKKPKETKADKAAEQKAEEAAQRRAYVQEIQSSPWTQMGDALANQYLSAAKDAQSLMSGAEYPTAAAQATQGALGLVGASPTSQAAQWLAGNQAAANAVTAPVANAMNTEAQAYAAEAGPISQALMQFGQANAIEQTTAPEQSWLSALASHITSNLSYYGQVPTADIPTLQTAPGLVQSLQQSGGFGGQSGGGLTALSSLKVPGTAPAANTGLSFSSLGSIPTASSTPAPSNTISAGG